MAKPFIKSIKVKNFRNLKECIFDFGPRINCIFGENGNGKTNLLEAIYLSYHKKSFRKKSSFLDFLSLDCEKPEILFSIDIESEKVKNYSSILSQNKITRFENKLRSNKKPPIPSVFINPIDSYLFHRCNKTRREWFDHHISLVNSKYSKSLNYLNKSLRQRNVLLQKKPRDFIRQIESLNEGISRQSFLILEIRNSFLKEINSLLKKNFEQLFNETHDLQVLLESEWTGFDQSKILFELEKGLEKDIISGRTLSGPHRDKYVFSLNGLSAENYGSLGQQKMAFLSLLFAYIELFRYKFNSYPIILIDDVSGELDRQRWQYLMGYLTEKQFQVFLTTANEDFRNLIAKFDFVKNMNLENGKITKLDNFLENKLELFSHT